MSCSSALLARLLLAAGPLAALGCNQPPPGPIRPVEPIKSYDPAAPLPSAPSASTAPTAPVAPSSLARCGSTFFVKTDPFRSGGPYRMPACYGRVLPAACLPASSPDLTRAIPQAAYASCWERGPEEQPDPKTSAPLCCYVLGAMGEGRPLLVARGRGEARAVVRLVAPLRRVDGPRAPAGWSA